MHRIISAFFLFAAFNAAAAEPQTPDVPAASLSRLAEHADLVMLAQAKDTDYFLRREIPVSGSAYLKVLIPYKTDSDEIRAGEIIEVYEKGLRPFECYFPNPTVFEEGRRYLVFLRRDPGDEDRYRGLPEGCALEVLVDSDNRYALRDPPDGMAISDQLGELAAAMTFNDGYAIVEEETLPPADRDSMLANGQIRLYQPVQKTATNEGQSLAPVVQTPGRQYIYTRGIRLEAVRRVMFPAGLPD